MVTVRYFAAAAEAAGRESETFRAGTVGELRGLMGERHGDGLRRVLTRCALLVAGVRGEDATGLGEDAVVDVLPPFAGG